MTPPRGRLQLEQRVATGRVTVNTLVELDRRAPDVVSTGWSRIDTRRRGAIVHDGRQRSVERPAFRGPAPDDREVLLAHGAGRERVCDLASDRRVEGKEQQAGSSLVEPMHGIDRAAQL